MLDMYCKSDPVKPVSAVTIHHHPRVDACLDGIAVQALDRLS